MLRYDESPEDSCRAIAYFLGKENAPRAETNRHGALGEASRRAVLRDLCWKASLLEPQERASVLAKAFQALLPDSLRQEFVVSLGGMGPAQRRPRFDIGIVTALGVEFNAVLTAFGRDPEEEPNAEVEGFKYWYCRLPMSDGDQLSIVVVLSGASRNVRCALTLARLSRDYRLEAVIMVGIAAGVRSKTKLGDVVIADRVHDYEEYRCEGRPLFGRFSWIRLKRPRPLDLPLKRAMAVDVERINQLRFDAIFQDAFSSTDPRLLPPKVREGQWSSVLHDGTIAAGEKLIADGTLERFRKGDERIRAGDMEDSGFAQAAEFMDLPWCIFRGVSDHGDPYKENGWQYIAALAAACAAKTFLLFCWLPDRRKRSSLGG